MNSVSILPITHFTSRLIVEHACNILETHTNLKPPIQHSHHIHTLSSQDLGKRWLKLSETLLVAMKNHVSNHRPFRFSDGGGGTSGEYKELLSWKDDVIVLCDSYNSHVHATVKEDKRVYESVILVLLSLRECIECLDDRQLVTALRKSDKIQNDDIIFVDTTYM